MKITAGEIRREADIFQGIVMEQSNAALPGYVLDHSGGWTKTVFLDIRPKDEETPKANPSGIVRASNAYSKAAQEASKRSIDISVTAWVKCAKNDGHGRRFTTPSITLLNRKVKSSETDQDEVGRWWEAGFDIWIRPWSGTDVKESDLAEVRSYIAAANKEFHAAFS